MFTENQAQHARMWFPCVDSCSSISTFEIQVTTSTDYVAICTGTLIRQEECDNEGLLKTAFFIENTKITPQSVGMIVGPFKVFVDPDLPFVTHFYLQHHSLKNLKHTNLILPKSFQLFEELSGVKYQDIFQTYKQVFIDDAYSEVSSFASLSIISSNLLMDEKIIDYTIDNYLKISKLVSDQYFSHFILMKSWSDLWLIQGLSGYFVLQLLQKEFGKNEYKFFLLKESKELVEIETHKQPLFTKQFIHPSEINSPYLYKKSPLVMNMIARIINYSNMKKYCLKIFESVKENESNRFLSTKFFIKSIRKNYSIDLKQFCEYWVYSTGIPVLECGFRYDSARNTIEFAIVQKNFEKIFNGNIAVRVQETDESLEYTISVEDETSHFEVPCKSKPKKKQRKKPGQEVNPSEINKVEIPIKWIRIDPEFEWIRIVRFKQTEQMWVHQLERDKDVIGQYEAVQGLSNFPESQNALSKIENILNDNTVYYQVRLAAIHSISKFSTTEQISPIDTLKKFYKGLFYDRKMSFAKQNDFSNLPLYYIKKEIPLGIAEIKDSKTDSMKLSFLIEIYKSNDNTDNKFSDCYFIKNLIQAMSFTPSEKVEKVKKYIEKTLSLDSLIPSPNHILTCACIDALAELQIMKKINFDLKEFWKYFDQGIPVVKLAACKAILKLCSVQNVEFDDILKRLIRIIKEKDLTPLFKHQCLNIIIDFIENPKNPHLISIRSDDEEKRSLVILLWKMIKSNLTEYDTRLRTDLISLYHSLWGSGTPHCYSSNPQLEEPIIEEESSRIIERKSIDYSQYRNQYSTIPIPKQDTKKRKNQPTPINGEEKKKAKKIRETPSSGNVITSSSSNKITIKVGEVKKSMEESQIQITEENKKKLEFREKDKITLQKHNEEIYKIRYDRFIQGKGDTTIILEADNISIPIRLYDTKTSKLLYQSLPLKCREIDNEYKGLTWFPCPGIIKIDPEENQRQLVEKGEIAFWCSGNSICIGYGQTQYFNIKGINDIFLYEPCNIFGFADDYTKQISKFQHSNEIIIKRPRRCCVEIENIGLLFEIDIYDGQTGDYIWNSLPMRKSIVGIFGDIRYFSFYGKPQYKPTKKTHETIRSYTYYGEVSYWSSGESILLATGGSEINKNEKEFKDLVKDQILLTEPVTIFGRIVNQIQKIPSSNMNDSVKMFKRCIKMTLGDVEFIADVHNSLSGDIVFRSCPIVSSIKLYGECLYFDADLKEKDLPQEPSLEKVTVDPHDLCLWIEKSNICLAYGKTGSSLKDEPRLTVPCNVFARIKEDYDVVNMLKDTELKEDMAVKIEIYDGYEEIPIG